MRPPRALWVPFDLGRPFGAPRAAALQTEVLRAALALLERQDGPVILEDFPHDAPRHDEPESMEGMVCPVHLRKPPKGEEPQIMSRIAAEIAQLAPWHEIFVAAHGRSTAPVQRNWADACVSHRKICATGISRRRHRAREAQQRRRRSRIGFGVKRLPANSFLPCIRFASRVPIPDCEEWPKVSSCRALSSTDCGTEWELHAVKRRAGCSVGPGTACDRASLSGTVVCL